MSGTRSAAPKARATDEAALVICAHGARGGVGVAEPHARELRRRHLFAEVHAAALKGRPGLRETLAAVRQRPVYLVPLLMAEGFTLRALRRELAAIGGEAARSVRLCQPVGINPRLVELIVARARVLCLGRHWRPVDTALLIAGHGTRRDADSGTSARAHGATIAARHHFAEVAVGFLEEVPTIGDSLARLQARHVAVVGLFVDRGEHGEDDIPKLLAAWRPRAAYAGPIGTDPMMADLILEQALTSLARPEAA